jgi:tetratricopeptide (TPR) repeat protein
MRVDQMAAVRRLIEWLDEGRALAADVSRALAALPLQQWDAWLAENPRAIDLRVMNDLLDGAYLDLDRDVARTLAISEFVLRHVGSLAASDAAFMRAIVEGYAWRVNAAALRASGDYASGLAAYQRAAELLRQEPLAAPELAAAERSVAYTEFEMNADAAPARAAMKRAAAELAAYGDAAGVALTLLYAGAVEFESDRYDAAMKTFQEAAELAEQIGNERLLAALLANLGQTAQMLGKPREAAHYLVRALDLYERHGMTACRSYAVWGLAQVLADEGDIDECQRQMTVVMDRFLEEQMPTQAAAAALDLVEVLVLREQSQRAAQLARGLVAIFSNAGLRREAMRALAFVGGRAEQGTLTRAHVKTAWTEIRAMAEPLS